MDTAQHIKQLKQLIFTQLKADKRLWDKENGDLNQILLLDLIEKTDEMVISSLLQEKHLREKFFFKIKEVYVFKTNDFRFFMEENKVDNSYTRYRNRIGLTDSKKFLQDSYDVVLDFPYKDCVLEGGQSTEEGLDTYFEYQTEKTKTIKQERITVPAGYQEKQAKRKEVFFNQTLAQDEIDRLLAKKTLVSWKRYTKEGAEEVKTIKRDENGLIKENLIIKGNNLLALHSLKKQFAGKIKLIYIDPPYNTGNDGFKYNDNFNHSTWLTFMKNRLEVARELLREDGVIFVQCDDNEQAYLKVLMDEVFGRDNFVGNFIWKKKSGGGNDSKHIVTEHENIFSFAKGIKNVGEWYELHDEKYLTRYKKEDKHGKYFWDTFARPGLKSPINYDIVTPDGGVLNGDWIWSKTRFLAGKKNNEIKFEKNSKKGWTIFFKQRLNKRGKKPRSLILKQGNSQVGTKEIEIMFNNRVFATPKPEVLIKHLVYISTQPNDIVLDYHLGSGTTAAVAHKMGRQYIGVEQMDYIEEVACERLKKVIDGEQGGISKDIGWQGGGDFIYCELAKWNVEAAEAIKGCKDLGALTQLFETLYKKYFLHYNLKINAFKDKVITAQTFRELPLDEQKRMFLTMLDLNQLYVPQSEMADERFSIAQADQQLTASFYNETT